MGLSSTVLFAFLVVCQVDGETPAAASNPLDSPTVIEATTFCLGGSTKSGFFPDSSDCHNFYQCFYLNISMAIGIKHRCREGQFWRPEIATCTPEGKIPCFDPCSDKFIAEVGAYAGDNCRSFYVCSESISYPMCCPDGTSFNSANSTCEEDHFCNMNCAQPVTITTTFAPSTYNSSVCIDSFGAYLMAVSGKPNAFVPVDIDSGNAVDVFHCPTDLVFNLTTCRCDFDDSSTLQPSGDVAKQTKTRPSKTQPVTVPPSKEPSKENATSPAPPRPVQRLPAALFIWEVGITGDESINNYTVINISPKNPSVQQEPVTSKPEWPNQSRLRVKREAISASRSVYVDDFTPKYTLNTSWSGVFMCENNNCGDWTLMTDEDTAKPSINIRVSQNKVVADVYLEDASVVTLQAPIEWHTDGFCYFVVSYEDGKLFRLYINKEKVAEKQGNGINIWSSRTRLFIGVSPKDTERTFDGFFLSDNAPSAFKGRIIMVFIFNDKIIVETEMEEFFKQDKTKLEKQWCYLKAGCQLVSP